MAETVPFKPNNNAPEPEKAPEPAPSPTTSRVYTNEEVSDIIRVALKNAEQGGEDTVNHAEMLTIGEDFGLTPEQISKAYEEIGSERVQEEYSEKAWLAFKLHVAIYVVVNLGLFLINLLSLSTNGDWWFLYPAVAWGMPLALHGIGTKYMPRFASYIVQQTMEQMDSSPLDTTTVARANFTIPDIYGSLAEVSGLIQVRNDCLLLEYETKDTIFGSIKSKVKELEIPFSDLSSMQFTRHMWSTKLTLQGYRLKTFASIPGSSSGKVTLTFDRASRAASEALATTLESRIG